MSSLKKKIVKFGLVFLFFSLAACYITYPLVFHLGDFITGFGDELLIVWIHNWVLHALSTNPISIFDANIYYPFSNTLAYSDTFFITSILGVITLLITQEPVSLINFTLISSFIFLGFSIFSLTYYLTKNSMASILSGLMVIFSPAVIDKYVHLQILAIAFVPLSLLTFFHFLKSKKTMYWFLTIGCLVLQTYNSIMPGYFIVFSIVLLFFFYFKKSQKEAKKLLNKKVILGGIVGLLLIIPITIPYFSVSHEFSYVRDIRDTIHLALQPEDFLYTNDFSRLNPLLQSLQPMIQKENREYKAGFLGFIFTILTILVIVYFIKKWKSIDWRYKGLFVISALGFILSLGPFLHLMRQTIHQPFPIPLPYALFYYLVPGFQGIRNSARWEMLFIIAIAVLIAVVLTQVFKRFPLKYRPILYGILVLGCVLEFNFPMHFYKVPSIQQFPPVYQWLNTTPKEFVIIEMPIYTWDIQPQVFTENMREYYATAHFRKMVNGASGYSPPPWMEIAQNQLISFPSENSLKQLRTLGVTHIVFHKKEYDVLHMQKFAFKNHKLRNGTEILIELKENKKVKIIKQFGDDYVISL